VLFVAIQQILTAYFPNRDVFHVRCKTCGTYKVSGSFVRCFEPNKYENKKHIFSGIIREKTEKGEVFELDLDKLQDLLDSSSTPKKPSDHIDKILIYISHRSKDYSSFVKFSTRNYSVGYAKNSEEFTFFLRKAYELKLLESQNTDLYQCRLSLKGWERVEVLKAEQTGKSETKENCSQSFYFNKSDCYVNNSKLTQTVAVGSNAKAHNTQFQQTNMGSDDLKDLARELEQLQKSLTTKAKTVENRTAIGAIAEAVNFAKNGDKSKLMECLVKAGKWSFEIAKEIGVNVAANAIST